MLKYYDIFVAWSHIICPCDLIGKNKVRAPSFKLPPTTVKCFKKASDDNLKPGVGTLF